VSNDPIAQFSADRGGECDPVRCDIDRATREDAAISVLVPPIRQREFPGNAGHHANVGWTFDSSVGSAFDDYDVPKLRLL
jgi:hypothetical protein